MCEEFPTGFRSENLVEKAREEFEEKSEDIKEEISSEYGIDQDKIN